MKNIFFDIVESFSSLWKMKMHGETMEIITPCATSNNYFISLFLSKRDDEFVVSDGGWIKSGMYDCELPEDPYFQKLMNFYIEECGIKVVPAKNTIFYYKKTKDVRLIPNIIFDLSEFASAVASASFIKFQTEKEINTQKRFSTKAIEYLREEGHFDDILINKPISEDLSSVKFNAIIKKGDKQSLINMVTGTDDNYFINSLGKSIMKYDVLEESNCNNLVDRKITLVDTSVRSFNSPKVQPYLSIISGKNGREMIRWDQKEILKSIAG